jgi:hypothetical protein
MEIIGQTLDTYQTLKQQKHWTQSHWTITVDTHRIYLPACAHL